MSGVLNDVPGVMVGHASLGDTGVSVIVGAPTGMTAGVDVRGGGPGTRETDLLAPHNTVDRVHAVVLAGGSAFGLAAADGVMTELEAAGIGFPVLGEDRPGPRVPIVPGAVIFDLFVGDPTHRPSAADGAIATRSALQALQETVSVVPASGSIGAGCGATAGVLRGGYGQASQSVGGFVVSAGIVANPVGEVIDPRTGLFYADPTFRPVDRQRYSQLEMPGSSLNTTIGVIMTNAPLTKAQATRLAMVGHDGIARAVYPAHSPLDGDTLFALSTADTASGVDIATLHALSQASADVVSAAIVDAVVAAQPGFGLSTYQELVS